MKYLTTTFSPAMLNPAGNNLKANVYELREDITKTVERFTYFDFTSAIGHEVTSRIIEALTGLSGLFNRANLSLNRGDELLVIIPNFRANEAREFTHKEVLDAGWRVFGIEIV
jgi:hypothetical protein